VPIYEYKCLECGGIAEVLSIAPSDDQSVTCPACGGRRMERLISGSYMVQIGSRQPGKTCCGRAERCEKPPCSTSDTCSRG